VQDQPQYSAKQQKLNEQRKEAARITAARKSLYTKTRHDSPELFEDLLKFIDSTYLAYLNSALKASGIINGEPTSLTQQQRTSLLDKADGISIVKMYIENNLGK
jgi:hypothetical protein